MAYKLGIVKLPISSIYFPLKQPILYYTAAYLFHEAVCGLFNTKPLPGQMLTIRTIRNKPLSNVDPYANNVIPGNVHESVVCELAIIFTQALNSVFSCIMINQRAFPSMTFL